MTRGLKLRRAGGSIAATLPKDMAERLHLAAGDTVLAVETDQGILLTPYDPLTKDALRRSPVRSPAATATPCASWPSRCSTRRPRWVGRLVVEAVHIDLVREHGGRPGLRYEGALEAALALPPAAPRLPARGRPR